MLKITVAEVGDVGVVKVTGKLGQGLWIKNDVGGTEALPPGAYRVKVTKAWEDDETGQRCIGKLIDEKDIAVASKAGTTGFRDRKAKAAFDPSTVYFNGSQLEEDVKPKAAKKSKGDHKGYSLKGVKVFQGMDGVGLNATLLRDGKPVCTILDEGCGGEMIFRWHDQARGESGERDLWDAFIAQEKTRVDDTKKNEYGRTERDYFDGAMWVNTLVDKMENDKRFRRMCKTKLLFQVGEQIGTDSFQCVKGLNFRPDIEKKYAGQKIRFLNDEFEA